MCILMFIIGFISGLYVDRKFYKESSRRMSHVTAERPRLVPFYDDVQFSTDTTNQQGQNLELKENMAYRLPKPAAVEIN